MVAEQRQTVEHLRAEIAFRAKLARQHVTGELLLPDYFTKEEHDEIIRQRAAETQAAMQAATEKGVRLSPFLELGAERGQRSVVVCSDFAAKGVAADISYEQLRTMEHFAELLGRDQLPVRVCCDANRLPFKSESFAFAFSYQFLHHFPSPAPIVAEIHRVLASGHYLFGDEPFKRFLKLALFRRSGKVYSKEERGKNRYRSLLESFLSEERSDEVEHGVLENDEVSLQGWAGALSVFDDYEAQLTSVYGIQSRLRDGVGWRNGVSWLLGGIVSGLGRKSGPSSAVRNVMETLDCPECMSVRGRREGDGSALQVRSDAVACSVCSSAFPIMDGVIFLLPHHLLRELYPQFARGWV